MTDLTHGLVTSNRLVLRVDCCGMILNIEFKKKKKELHLLQLLRESHLRTCRYLFAAQRNNIKVFLKLNLLIRSVIAESNSCPNDLTGLV